MADAPVPPAATEPVEHPVHTLLVGGRRVPSESGRTYPVRDHHGHVLAAVALGTRRDVRDAVAAARAAVPGWTRRRETERLRQLLAVEATLQERREELVALVDAAEGVGAKRATQLVTAALDRWVHHAGWADKLPGAPLGVVAVLAPQYSSLLGLLGVVAPALAAGCAVVLVPSQERPLPALVLGEVVAGVLEGGVLGVLTGRTAELAPWLAVHPDVDAVDLVGAPAALRRDLELGAAGSLTRVLDGAGEPDGQRPPDVRVLRALRR